MTSRSSSPRSAIRSCIVLLPSIVLRVVALKGQPRKRENSVGDGPTFSVRICGTSGAGRGEPAAASQPSSRVLVKRRGAHVVLDQPPDVVDQGDEFRRAL